MVAPNEYVKAIHEAAHAVVQYRTRGFVAGPVSIIADEQSLGRATQDRSISSAHADEIDAGVLTAYAAALAQERVDPHFEREAAAWADDDAALGLLRLLKLADEMQVQARAAALRERARELVTMHWTEIKAVATDLVTYGILHADEVQMLADVATAERDLAIFRHQMKRELAALPGRRGSRAE